jgi:FkbM family methyltransferase
MLRLLQGLDFPHKLGICERLFGASLARRGIAWVDTAAGIPWKLDLANATHRWIVYGKYEGAAFLDWARAMLPPDGVVVDSGANIGQMLLYVAQWLPRGRLLAIEPGAQAADWLAECLRRNPHLRVELLRCALGAADGSATLQPVSEPTVHGACNRVAADGEGERVRLRPLDAITRERGLEHVHLWKLDVEGYRAGVATRARERPLSAARAVTVLFGHPTGNPNSHHAALAHLEAGWLEAFCVPWMPSAPELALLSRIPGLKANGGSAAAGPTSGFPTRRTTG